MSSELKMSSIVCTSAVLAVASCLGWSRLAGAEEPKANTPAGNTVLFLGDSITAAGGYVRIIEAELAKQAPPWKVINHGMSSETVSDLSEEYHPGRRPCLFSRLDKELADAKPDWVVACYGINDGIYHPYNEKRFAAYQAGVMTLIKKVKASGARLVLLTAPPYAKPGPEFPMGISAAEVDKLQAKAVPGVIHVEAASFAKTGGKISWGGQFPNVLVHDSFGGGKQVYFQQQMKEQWADYTIDVPAAGACQIVMQAACINEDQLLEVRSGDKLLATLPLAPTFGVWQETKPVTLTLAKGQQTLRIQTPVSVNAENHKRGIAVKWFELRAPQ
jgi:lysophospholipase L1-like esterase